jgi:hypothetical protein
MKNVFRGMNKRLLFASVLCIAIVAGAFGYIAYSAISNYIMVHQTLTVPNQPGMALYQHDGTTLISSGALVTDLWSWTGTQFTVQFVIKNVGNTVLATGLNTSSVPSGWTLSITGNGTLTQGDTQTVTIMAIPPSLVGGTSSGDFDLWITG